MRWTVWKGKKDMASPLNAFLGRGNGGRLKQVLHFSAELAMAMFWIGLVLCFIAIVGDAFESAWAIHSFFYWVNPLSGMMVLVSWVLGGLDGVGAIWFVMYHYFRGSGHHETEEYQQTADIHQFDKQQVVHDAVNTWMSQYLTGMGLLFLIFIVGTDILGLFTGEWQGFTFGGYGAHGAALVIGFDWGKFCISLVVNIIVAGVQFGWSTLGLILCFHYREWAKGRARREQRVLAHADGSSGRTSISAQPTQQIGSGRGGNTARTLAGPTVGRAAIPQRASAKGGQGQSAHQATLAQTGRHYYEDDEEDELMPPLTRTR